MARRRMVQSNLVKNAIAAYFAAVEIHNKPQIPYRYEMVTLLLINAWELLLKAYVRKYVKDRSIFDSDGKSISFTKALNYSNDNINSIAHNRFTATRENLLKICEYRDQIVHFYCENLEPFIFMLTARAAVNFVEFIEQYFSKDILSNERLYILPLGFKLPFKPEQFLSRNAATSSMSTISQAFVSSIVSTIEALRDQGVEESIVLGFDIYLESVKKMMNNSEILAAITSLDDADIKIAQVKRVRPVNDSSAQKTNLKDEQLFELYPLVNAGVVERCRSRIPGFKKNKDFNAIMKLLKNDRAFCYPRKLSPKQEEASVWLYSEEIIDEIVKWYASLPKSE